MYRALSHSNILMDNNKLIWKLNTPLKILIFMWYLRRGVVLTKDNLTRLNWQGSKKCSFCTHDETIKHHFYQCKFARSIWTVIQIASNLYLPTSVSYKYGHWLDGIPNTFSMLIRVGAYTLLWSLWLCRDDCIFNGKTSSPMKVIHLRTHWLRIWSTL